MLRNILVPIVAIAILPSSFADTEFEDSIPLDLVKAFLGNSPYGEPRIYSDLSSRFPDIDVPDDLVLMGSIDQGYGVAAVYTTKLSDDQVEPLLRDAFLESNFVEFELPGMRGVANGFVSPSMNTPQKYIRYCHDTLGSLTLSYRSREQNGVVTISSNPANDSRSCADQLAEQQQAIDRRGGSQMGLQQYLPTMELPEAEPRRPSPFFSGGGWSGSRNSIETKAKLTIDWDIEAVFEHFTEQIEAQGWAEDTQNIGASSAIGIWTLSPVSGTDLIGTLTVLKTGDESFELNFQLTSTGANSNFGSSFIRSN